MSVSFLLAIIACAITFVFTHRATTKSVEKRIRAEHSLDARFDSLFDLIQDNQRGHDAQFQDIYNRLNVLENKN